MSDELDEELRRRHIVSLQPRLTGDLAGAGPLRESEVDHLLTLWDAVEAQPRDKREANSTFVTRVYRAARRRQREDDEAASRERNRRLADRITNRTDAATLDEVIEAAIERGGAFLDFPGPRARQLAEEILRLRQQIEEIAIREGDV